MDDTLMESIEPFHMEDAADFQTAYLAGYFANKYDVDASKSISVPMSAPKTAPKPYSPKL
jgi:hypothetical protein